MVDRGPRRSGRLSTYFSRADTTDTRQTLQQDLAEVQQHLASGSFGVTSCVRGVSRVSHDKVFIHEGVTNDVFSLHDDDAKVEC